jgi:putative hydrolase of the HAD superfamily
MGEGDAASGVFRLAVGTAPLLLFDLGGVIVDFRGGEGLWEMTKGAHSLDFCRDQWWRLPELDRLERGALSPEGFADAFIARWKLDLDRAAFIEAFKHWVRGRFDGVDRLLSGLGARHRLACLSNVNPVHWDRCVELGVDGFFGAHFLSHEMGVRKPELEIYSRVAEALCLPPGQIFFFDDVEANVDAAIRAGMRAALVKKGDARSALEECGFV